MNQYVKQYQKNSVETASPEVILIMLHDGIIQFLNKAKAAMEAKDIPNSSENLIKAQKIFYEFLNTMDEPQNPELAKHLSALYYFLINQLVEANTKQTVEPIDIVLQHTKDLKATWEQAISQNQSEAKASQGGDNDDEDEDSSEDEANYDA